MKPVTAIEPPFDLRLGAAHSGADIFPTQSPALPFPSHGMVRTHRACLADAQNLFQSMLPLQPPMSVPLAGRRDGKALVPERPESDFQKTIDAPACLSGCGSATTQPGSSISVRSLG